MRRWVPWVIGRSVGIFDGGEAWSRGTTRVDDDVPTPTGRPSRGKSWSLSDVKGVRKKSEGKVQLDGGAILDSQRRGLADPEGPERR